jgi:hypothetical protein
MAKVYLAIGQKEECLTKDLLGEGRITWSHALGLVTSPLHNNPTWQHKTKKDAHPLPRILSTGAELAVTLSAF